MKVLIVYAGWGKDDDYQERTAHYVHNQKDINRVFADLFYESGNLYRYDKDYERAYSTIGFDEKTENIERFNCETLDYDYPAYYGFKLLSEEEYQYKLDLQIAELNAKREHFLIAKSYGGW